MTDSSVVSASAFERARAAKAAKSALAPADLKTGRVYRAKRPSKAGDDSAPCFNDRTITWMGATVLMYDSPAVPAGRNYPKVSIEAFLEWASHDVTGQTSDGSYQSWPRE
jgi:hypothetical protein